MKNSKWIEIEELTTMSLKRLASLGGSEAPILLFVFDEWFPERGTSKFYCLCLTYFIYIYVDPCMYVCMYV